MLQLCHKRIFFVLIILNFGQALLDVTMVIEKPAVAYNEEAVLKCVAEPQYFQDDYFPFGLQADIGTGENLTSDRVLERNEPAYWPGHQLKISSSSGATKYGFISCTARNNATEEKTTVTGVIMSQNALIFPTSLNYRASLNGSVSMAVIQARRRPIQDLFWFRIPKSGTPIRAAYGRLRVNIERVTKKLEGPYVVFYQVRDSTVRIFQQGMTRLLVRSCVENKYGENCTKECPPCENGGVCDDVSGSCICPPGFMGEWCELACGSNRFGKYCQHICGEDEEDGCKEKLFCLPDPFGCSCAAGYRGTICSYECGSGYYGHNCELPCHCIDNKCDSFTGNCTVGCSSGWTGVNCQVPCANGTYGSNCNETCGFCSGGPTICDRITGFCPETKINDTELLSMATERNTSYCLFGFRPPICKEDCQNGSWSLDCNLECHCLNNTGCDVNTGFCDVSFEENGEVLCDSGWIGNACNETCPEGYYGGNCNEKCAHCKDGKPCHHITGACIASRGICDDGYEGWKCDQKCSVGFFGVACSYVCNCANGTNCDHITGACDGFCQAGWTGTNCHEACSFGTYGLNCSQECTNCKSVPPNRRLPLCDLRFGRCTAGCTKAWSGDRCDKGILCDQNPCFNDGTCVQSGDFYSCQCSKAYSGSHCEIKNPPCSSNPCLNNGSCTEINSNEFKCTCIENFEGVTCEVDQTLNDKPTSKPTKPPEEEDENSNNRGDDDGDDSLINDQPRDRNDDNSTIIIAAMCLGAVVAICALAFLLKSCLKKPTSIMAEQFAPIQPKPPEQASQKTSQSNVFSTSRELQPSIDEVPDEVFTAPEEFNHHMKKQEADEKENFTNFQNVEHDADSSQPCCSTSADASPLTTTDSQEESITFTETTTTLEKFSDSIETTTDGITNASPFSEKNKLAFDKPLTPPSGPSDISSQSLTINNEPKKRRFSRRQVQNRLSKNSLDRLEKIAKQANEESENNSEKRIAQLQNKTYDRNSKKLSILSPAGARALDPWDSTPVKNYPGPVVYGVAHRDVNMLITSPRSADEEFEMESRKGPMMDRREPIKSVVIDAK